VTGVLLLGWLAFVTLSVLTATTRYAPPAGCDVQLTR